MATKSNDLEQLVGKAYSAGFYTDIESDTVPPGLNEAVIRHISLKKREPQFLLDWRLRAYEHWLGMTEPQWAHVHHSPIDYLDLIWVDPATS
ncbi:MAG: Fe-S cluster assembly protein SufB, partial [Gammaproteobacteria bacterium]